VLRGGYWKWPRALTLGYILDTQDLGKAMLGLLELTSQADVFLGTRIPLDTTLTPKGVCASGGAAPTFHSQER
jgi:hypothetical protein